MQQRIPTLLDGVIGFAHRGARAHAPENTIAAFTRALEMGATGLESDVWLTQDRVAVLDHDGMIGGRMRRQRLADLKAADLPIWLPPLSSLLDHCGDAYHLSLDLKEPAAGPVVIDLIRSQSPQLLHNTWLCHPDLDLLTQLRPHDGEVRLVHSTRLSKLTSGPERHAARLAESRIDAINLRRDDWNGGLVSLFHRFERAAFAWNVQFEHELREVLRMGCDAVYSDYVDRMMAAISIENRLL